jgi:Uncharacterised conserved protein
MDLVAGYESSSEEEDNEAKQTFYHGQTQVIPYVEGRFPSFIYLECEMSPQIKDVIEKSIQIINSNLNSNFTIFPSDFHVSLSKLFTLIPSEIDLMVSKVRDSLKNMKRIQLTFQNIDLLSNELHTRAFLVYLLSFSSAEDVSSFVKSIDQLMATFQKDLYYNPAIHHLSFASQEFDGNQASLFGAWKESFLSDDIQMNLAQVPLLNISVSKVCLKIGNRAYSFTLP